MAQLSLFGVALTSAPRTEGLTDGQRVHHPQHGRRPLIDASDYRAEFFMASDKLIEQTLAVFALHLETVDFYRILSLSKSWHAVCTKVLAQRPCLYLHSFPKADVAVYALNGYACILLSGGICNISIFPRRGHLASLRTVNLEYAKGLSDTTIATIAASCPLLEDINVNACQDLTDKSLVSLPVGARLQRNLHH